jgi:hypothetical protein
MRNPGGVHAAYPHGWRLIRRQGGPTRSGHEDLCEYETPLEFHIKNKHPNAHSWRSSELVRDVTDQRHLEEAREVSG